MTNTAKYSISNMTDANQVFARLCDIKFAHTEPSMLIPRYLYGDQSYDAYMEYLSSIANAAWPELDDEVLIYIRAKAMTRMSLLKTFYERKLSI